MQPFTSIANFRDVGKSISNTALFECGLCPNLIFRSAKLDDASDEDFTKLLARYNVVTILDLSDEECDKEREMNKEKSDRRCIHIKFAGKKFQKYAVWRRADAKTKFKMVGYGMTFQKPRAAKIVGKKVLSKGGLEGLYHNFIDFCDKAIYRSLAILCDASNYPLLIHCSQGKDRTGLVTALALAAIGVEEEIIIADYSKSQAGLERVHEEVVDDMAKKGFGPDFADAPPEVMRGAFAYIKEKHGSIEAYLDHIKFDAEHREHLKQTISAAAASLPPNTPLMVSASQAAPLTASTGVPPYVSLLAAQPTKIAPVFIGQALKMVVEASGTSMVPDAKHVEVISVDQ